MTTNPYIFEDFKINVKLKLAALWTAVIFCYVYGDFFTLFVPGRIENLMKGDSGNGTTTPIKLLLYAVLMSLPPLMVFLSLALKPKVNRILNLLLGAFFTVIMILVTATSIDSWMLFYSYLGIVEIIITALIIVYAWRWPKQH